MLSFEQQQQAMLGQAPSAVHLCTSRHIKNCFSDSKRCRYPHTFDTAPNGTLLPYSRQRIPCSVRPINPPALLGVDTCSLDSNMFRKSVHFACAAFPTARVRPVITISQQQELAAHPVTAFALAFRMHLLTLLLFPTDVFENCLQLLDHRRPCFIVFDAEKTCCACLSTFPTVDSVLFALTAQLLACQVCHCYSGHRFLLVSSPQGIVLALSTSMNLHAILRRLGP